MSSLVRDIVEILHGRSHKEENDETMHGASIDLDSDAAVQLLLDIEALGWDHIHAVAPTFASLSLQSRPDHAGRRHTLTVVPPSDYPSGHLANVTADIPAGVSTWPYRAPALKELELSTRTGTEARAAEDDNGTSMGSATGNIQYPTTLRALYDAFEASIEACQVLWDDLDDLDQHVNPGQISRHHPASQPPPHHARKDTRRRIRLGDGCQVVIDLDPMRPRLCPVLGGTDSSTSRQRLQFVGPAHLCQQYRCRFRTHATRSFRHHRPPNTSIV